MELLNLLQSAIEKKASDIFIIAGCPISLKIGDTIQQIDESNISPDQSKKFLEQIYQMTANHSIEAFLKTGDDDFSFSVAHLGRFRCNAYMQRNSFASVLRVLSFVLPKPEELHIPEIVLDLYKKEKGLVLITGASGSGKSTTLSCIIDKINNNRTSHVITIEDPIEFLHKHKKSIVSQREVSIDTISYVQALRAALRQAPDVILLGEMRDYETISTAMTAAETGQLVLSTLHTTGAANTIDRIIDVFPPSQQQQIRVQLSMVLQAVVSQQLIPALTGGLVPAFEIMLVNSAIRNMIREAKVHQIDNTIFTNSAIGMVSMDNDLLRLYKEGTISKDTLMIYCSNSDQMVKKI